MELPRNDMWANEAGKENVEESRWYDKEDGDPKRMAEWKLARMRECLIGGDWYEISGNTEDDGNGRYRAVLKRAKYTDR